MDATPYEGGTWALIETPVAPATVTPSQDDPEELSIAAADGQVWVTKSSGRTWQTATDASRKVG